MTGAVIVTGGASGLGAAVVAAIQDAGGTPYVLDLKPPEADVPYAAVDLADTRAAERATRELVDQACSNRADRRSRRQGGSAGIVKGVVTAAGMDIPAPLDGIAGSDWERIVTVNLLGTAAVVRAALPALKASHGTVVTVASTLGIKAVGDATAYCAAKFGVVGFTRALAAELAGTVNVTLLIPGGMKTAFFDARADKYKPAPDAPLNDPAHTAAAVMFALSQPPGCAVREMIVCSEVESSYP